MNYCEGTEMGRVQTHCRQKGRGSFEGGAHLKNISEGRYSYEKGALSRGRSFEEIWYILYDKFRLNSTQICKLNDVAIS